VTTTTSPTSLASIDRSLPGGQLIRFQGDYPSLDKLAANGSDLDRFLLTDFEKSARMEVVRDVQPRLTDDIIRSAARRMPSKYYELRGTEHEDILVPRRDKLSAIAESYYDRLAHHVNIHCTRESELVTVDRPDKTTLVVSVCTESTGPPYYRRRCIASEIDEVRMGLAGGPTASRQAVSNRARYAYASSERPEPMSTYSLSQRERFGSCSFNRGTFDSCNDTLPMSDWAYSVSTPKNLVARL
jgi:hypothetical protein